jgi:hypothetical protein
MAASGRKGDGDVPQYACPLAASAAVAALVTGPRRPVEVVAATPQAIYLATGDPELPALCLATPDAVRVPCALVTPALPADPAGGTVGLGALVLGPFTGRVARWWRPPRPCGLTADRLPAVAVQLAFRVPVKLDPAAEAVREDLIRGLATGGPLTGPVRRLLGRGPGLTPFGDDVLAGALVTLGALGDPGFARLGAVVDALAPARTTFVSAALLRHAARGECVPELAAVLDGGSPGVLLRVGHTSGAGLALGALTAAHAVLDGPHDRHNFPEVVPSDPGRDHNFPEVVTILGVAG